ncbi:hypothetical protein Pmani_014773 [Petrolisthes manimaculis]|uniref:Uncharacterized protein n=1 Tax=Petrolisthes manimaculis TaxID=1843537 RepID=A0AAE1UAM3_9EUCA|nr:hypothetical protein Pmani_014773 [Petrolisthes manimaculis]
MAGTNPGENFGSEVVRVKAKGQLVSREFEKQNSTKEYNLFMKFLRGNYFSRQMGNQMQGPLRELLIFSDIITELNEFQAQMTGDKYRINIPGFVHGICTTDEYVLVMQDLSIDGSGCVVGAEVFHQIEKCRWITLLSSASGTVSIDLWVTTVAAAAAAALEWFLGDNIDSILYCKHRNHDRNNQPANNLLLPLRQLALLALLRHARLP